ncbi:hypothetical protein DPMN_028022 [Dreissena polymorpha]|uniref:PDZ domain-containing protein n=1 Tax=Dreissena polymorpha TaxID=45954 RepID=A0A9D4RE63_DREPO|nr:hypothetical protein DPMN_028022 [Dreissena polymorpha]
MNLQRIQIQREGHRRFIEKYLEKIEQSKENDSLTDFHAILNTIEAKVTILETLNEKILSQTEIEGLEEEIFQTDTYSAELDIQLCRLQAFRDQQEKRAAPHTTDLPRDDQRNSSNQQRNNNGLNPEASSFFPDRTVTSGSVAANSNSPAPGDVVLKIGNVNATNISHNEAQEVVCGATNILQLTIKKGPGKSASMSPTPIGSGQFSTPLEKRDKYSTLPDYRIGTGYQALNNVSSGYNNGQESSAYDMRQLEQTPPMSGQQSQHNKYPYMSKSGIQLQLNPPTQIDIRIDNSYNQRGDYNDGGSYSQPMSHVQYTNGNRTESPYQRQTSVGSNRQFPYSGHPQSYFKKPTPFSPGCADNFTDNSPEHPGAQRQTSSGSQPVGNVYDATISPGFQSCSYMSDEPPPTPPPPDLSTDSFLQAFRRFASRKSLPTVMVLDNATTYIAASNHLKKLFNYQVVQEELSRNGTERRFIPKTYKVQTLTIRDSQ